MTEQLSNESISFTRAPNLEVAEAGASAIVEYSVGTVQDEKPAANPEVDWGDFTTVFFAAGVVINLVMITAYLIWAYKQLGKAKSDEE